jgi:Flp pilus assembly protein TadB
MVAAMNLRERFFIAVCLLLLVATLYATGDLTRRDLSLGVIVAAVFLFVVWLRRSSRRVRRTKE